MSQAEHGGVRWADISEKLRLAQRQLFYCTIIIKVYIILLSFHYYTYISLLGEQPLQNSLDWPKTESLPLHPFINDPMISAQVQRVGYWLFQHYFGHHCWPFRKGGSKIWSKYWGHNHLSIILIITADLSWVGGIGYGPSIDDLNISALFWSSLLIL